MSIPRTPTRPARALAPRLSAGATAVVFLLLGACGGDSSGPGGGGDTATLSGTVRAAVGLAVLDGTQITIGQRQTTSDATGHFELTDLPVGAATVMAERPGYLAATAAVTLSAGANSHDFALDAQEIFLSGAEAIYVPAGGGALQGVIIILGGPNTSGFVTGGQIAPANNPTLELSLQALGASLRALATSMRVALLGTATIALANSSVSDDALFAAIDNVAGLSAHPELAGAPVLMAGFSAGAPEAAGLVSRHPSRAIGLLERVPTSVTALTLPAALAVPTFLMQAELDNVVNNPAVQMTYSANRSAGGLWALAVEPGIGHSVASSQGNAALTLWIRTALTLRLPATAGAPLVTLDETSGWLGDPATLAIAPWASYPGDPTMASWLLAQTVATSWQALGTGSGGSQAARQGEVRPPPADSRSDR